jgi:hypothetical protein
MYVTNTSLLYCLLRNVRKLSLAPPGRARDVGATNLYDQIVTMCKSHDSVNGLLSIRKGLVTLLVVYVDAACSVDYHSL